MLDVAVLKSWNFARGLEQSPNHQLPYRIDLLEEHGLRLSWNDWMHVSDPRFRKLKSAIQRLEAASVPFVQTTLMSSRIHNAPITLAMFESEGNFLAAMRRLRPLGRRSVFAIMSCWLGHLLVNGSSHQRAAYRWVYQSVDRVYYFSRNQSQILEEGLQLSPDRLRYLPFGVDTENFVPSEHAGEDFVLAVGRDRGRDWRTFFRAVDGLDLKVKVCSRPSDVAGHRVPGNVELLGYVDRQQYRELLGNALLVSIASRPMVYPSGQSVLLEAMATGKAVVVTSTPALADYMQVGIDCLGVAISDPDALRLGIETLAGDADLRRRLEREARRSAVERFSAERMWASVAEDLIALASGRS